jgi:hypothetical protein
MLLIWSSFSSFLFPELLLDSRAVALFSEGSLQQTDATCPLLTRFIIFFQFHTYSTTFHGKLSLIWNASFRTVYKVLSKFALNFSNKLETRTATYNGGFVTLSVGLCLPLSLSFLEVRNVAIVNWESVVFPSSFEKLMWQYFVTSHRSVTHDARNHPLLSCLFPFYGFLLLHSRILW